jgi:hypothetical protein
MRYRYRTPALVGVWRRSAQEACDDAVSARQADRGEDGRIVWRASARLEAGRDAVEMTKRAS